MTRGSMSRAVAALSVRIMVGTNRVVGAYLQALKRRVQDLCKPRFLVPAVLHLGLLDPLTCGVEGVDADAFQLLYVIKSNEDNNGASFDDRQVTIKSLPSAKLALSPHCTSHSERRT